MDSASRTILRAWPIVHKTKPDASLADSVQYYKITNVLELFIAKLHRLNAHHALQDIHLTMMYARIVQKTASKLTQMEFALLAMKGSASLDIHASLTNKVHCMPAISTTNTERVSLVKLAIGLMKEIAFCLLKSKISKVEPHL
jgi:hypothetical protein